MIQDAAAPPTTAAAFALDTMGFSDGDIAVIPSTNRSYVIHSNGLKVIDTVGESVVTTVGLPNIPINVEVSRTLNRIYTDAEDTNGTFVIDGGSTVMGGRYS